MTESAGLVRVVYVVSLFPCWSETFIVREIRTLIEDGVDVRIVSLKNPSEALVQDDAAALLDRVRHPGHWWRTLIGAGAALLRQPGKTLSTVAIVVGETWRQPAVLAKSLVGLARGLAQLSWLRRFDPQYIHAHWATYPSTVAWALGRMLERPFGFTCHAHDIFLDRQMLKLKIEQAALAVTISRHNVAWLHCNVSPLAESRLKIVHCGVDLARIPWTPDGREPGSILAVGRLDPIKGFETLISALALLSADGIDFRCRIVGDGPERARLTAMAHAAGIADRVEFTGALPQHEVRAALARAAVFALPCRVAPDGNRDGIPVALMEAMASGCVALSTRVSGVPELIEDGRNGVLVEECDPIALAAALRRLLDDDDLRRALSIQARARVEREFDARSEARKLRALMAEATHAA